jgi:hypothetical protein
MELRMPLHIMRPFGNNWSDVVGVAVLLAAAVLWYLHQRRLFARIYGFKPTRVQYSFRAQRIKLIERRLNEMQQYSTRGELSHSRTQFEQAIQIADFFGYLPETFRDEANSMRQKDFPNLRGSEGATS